MHKQYLYIITVVLLLFFSVNLRAARLAGSYDGTQCPKLSIGIFENGSYSLITSVTLDSEGKFDIQLPDNRKGVLLIACANGKPAQKALDEADNTSSLQFLYDGQDIVYETSWRWHSYYLKIKQGGAPTQLIDRLSELRSDLHEKLEPMGSLIDNTPAGSEFFATITKEYTRSIRSYNESVKEALSGAPNGSFLKTILTTITEPEPPTGLQGESLIEWLRLHLFDGIDLCAPLTYNSPFFTERLQRYFYIWKPEGLALESEFAVLQERGVELLKTKVAKCGGNIKRLIEINVKKQMAEN